MHNRFDKFSLWRALFTLLFLMLLLDRLPAQPTPVAPPASSSVTIPFDLIGDHIMLRVTLDGRGPFWFALDTGAYNCLTAATAQVLGVEPQQSRLAAAHVKAVRLSTGRARVLGTPMPRTRLASVRIGDLKLTEEPFAVIPLPDIEAVEGVAPFGGLIGYELFRQYVVRIDYERRLLTLTPPEQFHYAGTGGERDLTFLGHIPQITAQLDGQDGVFNLDTGDRRSLAVFKDFRARCSPQTRPMVQAMTGWGVRGPVWSDLGRARTLNIGGEAIAKPLVEFDQAKGGAFDFTHAAGNIGGCILKQFNITLDYSRRQAFFEKNAAFGTPTVWDRSGLWLNQDGVAFKVIDVTENGPAALAGLRVGDRVTALDGRPSSQLTLATVRQTFRREAPGQRVTLTVQPQGTARPREVVLVLKELV